MMLRDMQDDRARFEQDEIAVLIGRDLAERMQRAVAGSFIVANDMTRRTS
jgi:2-keto-4-pentenoate hydratase/2-oxohepta-3-ene-1,7-dioic acid hydratase in catechol pathway